MLNPLHSNAEILITRQFHNLIFFVKKIDFKIYYCLVSPILAINKHIFKM